MSYKINEQKRLIIRQKILAGAKCYKKYLMDKDFMVICEDGSIHRLKFFPKDFQHLTGILSDLSESDFFKRCYDKTISVQNILEDQKYNFSTLKFKTMKVEYIDKIIYGNSQNSLFMINLHTKTRDYPVAVRNKDLDTCIGFTGTVNRARTLRKYVKSEQADKQLEIIAIFGKRIPDQIYSEQIYVKSRGELLRTAPEMVEKVIHQNLS